MIIGLQGVLVGVRSPPASGDLLAGQVVVRRGFDIAEDADRRAVQHPGVGQPGQPEGERRIGEVSVVDDQRRPTPTSATSTTENAPVRGSRTTPR